jgi:hypothetical protein
MQTDTDIEDNINVHLQRNSVLDRRTDGWKHRRVKQIDRQIDDGHTDR